MSDQLFFEDFQPGATFESPPWTLSEKDFLAFQALTGDDHPIHYDADYCRRLGHPERLAHGLLVMAHTALGKSNLAPRVHGSMLAFLEQSGRFLKPVYVGDTLSPRLIVTETKPQRTTGVVTLRVELDNQRGERVLDGRHVYLVRRRQPRP